jgi:hypothetical protein
MMQRMRTEGVAVLSPKEQSQLLGLTQKRVFAGEDFGGLALLREEKATYNLVADANTVVRTAPPFGRSEAPPCRLGQRRGNARRPPRPPLPRRPVPAPRTAQGLGLA